MAARAAFAKLIADAPLCAIGPGKPNRDRKPDLDAMTIEAAFDGKRIVDRNMAMACLSGVWLLHNYLDESHVISQSISTPTGSYWHGIMHRREPDYGNSKYWFRRVGTHPAFAPLRDAAVALPVDPSPNEEMPWRSPLKRSSRAGRSRWAPIHRPSCVTTSAARMMTWPRGSRSKVPAR